MKKKRKPTAGASEREGERCGPNYGQEEETAAWCLRVANRMRAKCVERERERERERKREKERERERTWKEKHTRGRAERTPLTPWKVVVLAKTSSYWKRRAGV